MQQAFLMVSISFEPKNKCDHAVSFVRDITAQQVVETAERMLKRFASAKHKQ